MNEQGMHRTFQDYVVNKLIGRKLLSRIEKFKGVHSGEACYIFGDGPSVKWFDLRLFGDKTTICSGLIPFHKDANFLNIKYCTVVDPWFFWPECLNPESSHDGLKPTANAYVALIRANPEKNFFINIANYPCLRGGNINYVYRSLPPTGRSCDFALSKLNLFGGSFHAPLALAYLLGFSQVYLVGFDAWTLQPARTRRFYELGEGDLYETKNFAKHFLDTLRREMEIYTIGPDCTTSRNAIRIGYEEYTGAKPVFRENFDLMSQDMLEILAHFPAFNIFE